jgi:hypothetical protein
MVHQPVPKVTDDDVVRIARRDFGEARVDEVLSLLSRYGTEQGPERLRVRVGILKLAAGDIRQLPACLEKARMDYRDVIMDAEMPNYVYREKDSARVQAVIDFDWRAYCEWFEKKTA